MVILPVLASRRPASTRHIRQLPTTVKPGMPAIVRNLDARPLGSLDGVEPLAVGKFDFVSVDQDVGMEFRSWESGRGSGGLEACPLHFLCFSLTVSRRAATAPFHRHFFHRVRPAYPRIGAFDVFFQFAAELADGVLDGPGGAVGQAANGGAGNDADRVGDLQQQVEVLQPAPAGADAARSSARAQWVPSRQGVHWPQLSWAKKRQLL